MTKWSWRKSFWVVMVTLACLRVIRLLWRGLAVRQGDFFATLPGGFVKELNPTLWDSADLSASWAYQQDVFLYGPAQYLVLYPVLYWSDSYAEITRFLWFAYAGVLALSLFVIGRCVRLLGYQSWEVAAGLFCLFAFFFPLHQAFLQREFEIVVLGVTCVALYFVLRSRPWVAGALMGFITWFKFFPLIWLPYLVLRRWWSGVLAFVAMTGVVAVLTVVVLGHEGMGAVWNVVQTQVERRTDPAAMCAEWQPETRYSAVRNSTWADAGWALCSLGDLVPALPVRGLYIGLLLTLGGIFVAGFLRLERGPKLDERTVRWRRGLEVSLVILASTTLVHAHFYYLTMLIIPLGLLLARYLAGRSRSRLTLLLVSYLLLSVFGLPPSLVSMLLGVDLWFFYMRHLFYFPGQLLLFGLVFWEYFRVSPLTQSEATA